MLIKGSFKTFWGIVLQKGGRYQGGKFSFLFEETWHLKVIDPNENWYLLKLISTES